MRFPSLVPSAWRFDRKGIASLTPSPSIALACFSTELSGFSRSARPVGCSDPSVSEVAKKIRYAGDAVPDAAGFWLDFVAKIRFFSGSNDVMKPRITGVQVGARGQFDLEHDETLIVTVPKTDARYQSLTTPIADDELPKAQLVLVTDLRKILAPAISNMSPEERRA